MLFRVGTEGLNLAPYQATFKPLLYEVGLAIVLTLLLEETGPAARRPSRRPDHDATWNW